MDETINILVFVIVVLLRIGIPLAIPRYPLPSIIAALVIDAADQTIFQVLTTLDLDGYQSYDKALDIYYLAIAYVATMRNWANLVGFRASRFLWYYRLVGVTAFELLHWRPLLLIFPNTFEYFFIWYEAARTRWNPVRFAARTVIGAAAAIWIFIKLPQEYWIHIAQLDTTDFIKEDILGVSADTSWGDAIGENLWVVPVVAVIVAVLVYVVRRVSRRLPPADWKLTIDADDHRDINPEDLTLAVDRRIDRDTLIEKIVLVGLISIIFGQVLPGVGSDNVRLVAAIAAIIVANAFVSTWLARRGRSWESMVTEFGVMAVVNLGLAVLWMILISDDSDAESSIRVAVFFVLLLTLIVTFYDRYRPIYERRMEIVERSNGSGPADR